MSRRSIAIASIVVLMIVWGSTFVVTKAAAREIAPSTLALLRFLIAALVLVPFALKRGGLKSLPQPLPWASLIMMALTGIAGFTIAFNYALVEASASQGALIYAFLPAAVALAAAMFLKESISKRRIAGIVLSICGVALVVIAGESDIDSPRPVLGALWMLGAVLCWAAYTVFAKNLADTDYVVTAAAITVIGTAILVPLAAGELLQVPWQRVSLSTWLGLLFLGVIASALAYVIYGYALRELDASLVGVFINLDPIVGVLTAVIFLGETLHGGQIAGGLIALAGMWLASTRQ